MPPHRLKLACQASMYPFYHTAPSRRLVTTASSPVASNMFLTAFATIMRSPCDTPTMPNSSGSDAFSRNPRTPCRAQRMSSRATVYSAHGQWSTRWSMLSFCFGVGRVLFFSAFTDNYIKRRFEAIIRASTLPTQNKTTFILLLCDCLPQVIASCKNLFLTGPWYENISFVRSLSFVFLHISFFVQIHLFPVL